VTTEVVFADEAYDVTAEIYVVGGVIVDRAAIPTLLVCMDAERKQAPLPDKKPFHWRYATVGRKKGFVATTIVSQSLTVYGVVKERVTAGQQEIAREACLGRLVAEIAAAGASEIVLDTRNTTGKVFLDNRTIGRLRGSGTMPTGLIHRFDYPTNEPLLRVADAVAGATVAAVAVLDTQFIQPLRTLKICLVP
jgi:hypothetical protein